MHSERSQIFMDLCLIPDDTGEDKNDTDDSDSVKLSQFMSCNVPLNFHNNIITRMNTAIAVITDAIIIFSEACSSSLAISSLRFSDFIFPGSTAENN